MSERNEYDKAIEEAGAIHETAYRHALSEGKDQPESRHLEAASQAIDQMRSINPDFAERFIAAQAKIFWETQELGQDRITLFGDVLTEAVERVLPRLMTIYKVLRYNVEHRDPASIDEEMLTQVNECAAQVVREARMDQRIQQSLVGQEYLLEKQLGGEMAQHLSSRISEMLRRFLQREV